ncbi:glucosamine-6-phosphate isomerase, partial [Escherichia coli]|nr:glucosamine-6-phosphate isomerase [Escherichia coli]
YDDKKSYFEALGVPAGQVYPIAYEKDAIELIADKIKTKENKGKLTLQVVSIDEQGKLNVSIRQGLMEAREIFLVVTGANKRDVVEKLYQENGKTSFEPADLKAHRMVNVILDKEAAAGLPE